LFQKKSQIDPTVLLLGAFASDGLT
jgi:hypothetical protein